ncbi:Uncharacterised protein g6515 [Pycnogonum litorale]
MRQSFSCGVKDILFIPYANPDPNEYSSYASNVKVAFERLGLKVESIHEFQDPVDAVNRCRGIFIGGGNTFVLLKTLYEKNIIESIRKRVLSDNVPYMGSSAGSNVSTVSINTTNDMPIVYLPTFKALNLVPFNINAHYLDRNVDSTHMGETRETRINEYHKVGDNPPVLGIREGSWIEVNGDKITLKGETGARLFVKGSDPREYVSDDDLSFLLNCRVICTII